MIYYTYRIKYIILYFYIGGYNMLLTPEAKKSVITVSNSINVNGYFLYL